MTASHATTKPDDTTRKLDLNLTQVSAAALAAVTAAVLGSRVGAAGTLIGAAGASVITNVATAVYRASLERSRERVRFLAQRTRPVPTSGEVSTTEQPLPAEANAAPGDERIAGSTDPGPRSTDRSRLFATLRWGAVIVGTLGAFILAMTAITGFELASGETMSGNNKGTTVGRVINPPADSQDLVRPSAPQSSSTPTSEAPTATTTPSATATPDGSASAEPSPSQTSGTSTPSTQRPSRAPIPTLFPRAE